MILRRVEHVAQHLLHELEVWALRIIESAVEGDEGAAKAKAVTRKLLLIEWHYMLD